MEPVVVAWSQVDDHEHNFMFTNLSRCDDLLHGCLNLVTEVFLEPEPELVHSVGVPFDASHGKGISVHSTTG